jgi:basic amino acid/polyamine antiporter, APA family
MEKEISFDQLVNNVSVIFATEMHVKKDLLVQEFYATTSIDPALVIPRVSVLYAKHKGIDHSFLHIVL